MTFSKYIEDLAIRHVDIRHMNNDEVHFLSSEAEQHTTVDSILHYPAVIIDRGSGFGYSGGPGACKKNKEFILLVLEHVSDTSNYVEIDAAINKCERILDELLNQLIADKREYRMLLAFSLESVEADYVYNADNQQFGVAAAFNLENPHKAINCTNVFKSK